MEDMKFSLRALAVLHGWTYEEMSERTGIKARRLMDINYGVTAMTAKELMQIAEATGVDARQIEIKQ